MPDVEAHCLMFNLIKAHCWPTTDSNLISGNHTLTCCLNCKIN